MLEDSQHNKDTSNRNNYNPSEPSSKPLIEPPTVTVPKHIRTTHFLPRTISLIIVLAWIPIYYSGVSAIMQSNNNSNNSKEIEFHKGTTWHCIQSNNQINHEQSTNEQTQYVGYAQTILNSDSNGIELQSVGAFRLRMQDRPILVKLTLNAKCNEYFKLNIFNFKIEFDNNSLVAERVEDRRSIRLNTVIKVDNSNSNRTIKQDFPFPDPIFLLEKRPDYFSLVMPRGFARQLDLLSPQTNTPIDSLNNMDLNGKANLLSSFLGLSVSELASEQAHICRSQVLSEPSPNNLNNYIEFGKYMRFIAPQLGSSLNSDAIKTNILDNRSQG